jgi:hypothetical protein
MGRQITIDREIGRWGDKEMGKQMAIDRGSR